MEQSIVFVMLCCFMLSCMFITLLTLQREDVCVMCMYNVHLFSVCVSVYPESKPFNPDGSNFTLRHK